MKLACRTVAVLFLAAVGHVAHGQVQAVGLWNNTKPNAGSRSQARVSDLISCDPAPCVLPPVEPSETGLVTTAAIVSNPANPKQLLLGTQNNTNCTYPSFLGFYLSNDGGSTWELSCMTSFAYRGEGYEPAVDPMVAYDRHGTAYIAGFYIIQDDFSSFGLDAFQKSSDGGKTWSEPLPALGHPDAVPAYEWIVS